MKTIETYMPVFHGFYSTIWDCENDIDNFLDDEGVNWEQIEFNNEDYQNDIAKGVCDAMEELLKDFITKINFQSVVSPKYYNFSNDSINCEFELSEINIRGIREFIYNHKEQYQEYLKDQYTSYDGFLSSYSNEFEGWKEYTNDFTDYEDKGHYLGSILEFICQMLGIDQEVLYNEVHYNGDLNGQFYCSVIKE